MALIDGVEKEIEFVNISVGCSITGAELCTLVRVKDTGELFHIPGSLDSASRLTPGVPSEPEQGPDGTSTPA